jgi:isocitrate/isopropylmalate dehydrogenase
MFEPIHGSAPRFAGQNVASPVATIVAVQMMLEHLGEREAAQRLEGSLVRSLGPGKIHSLSTASGIPTPRYSDIILEELGVKA